MFTPVKLLRAEQVQQIHEASLEILEHVGLLVRNQAARARFARHGCRVDAETHRVTFPRAVVEAWRQQFPPTFTLHGRDPQYDRTIPGDGPLISTSGAAPNVIDPDSGEERRSRAEDIARIAQLINALPGYDIFSISTTADDAAKGRFHLSRFYPALKNCVKPVTGSAPNAQEAENVYRLGCLIAGSEAAYRARPFITYASCPVISPLTMDVDSTGMMMQFAEEGLPHYVTTTPSPGLSAPLTLSGALALANAEFLAYAILAQMVQPGTPVIYFVLPALTDVRTGAYAPGAIETGMMGMGCAQMARYYGVPCGGFAGLTNAKVNDAQAGFETGMSGLAAALAGVDFIKMAGLVDALMAFDFCKAVIDNEMGLMIKRAAGGMAVDAENMALDVVAEVGPGGIFMDQPHTLRHMRSDMVLTRIADRQSRRQWAADGGLDAHQRALRRVHEILAGDNPAVFGPEVDARIQAAFRDLVSRTAAVV